MILIPTQWQEWTSIDKIEWFTSITKKEEVENLLSSNKKIITHVHHNEEENKFRKNIGEFLKQIIGKDQFNIGKIIDYHIFTEWESSVAVKITIEDGKEYIFKARNDSIIWWENKIYIEAKSLEIRKKLWVKTPEIYKKSTIDFNGMEIPYIIMEYIKPTRKRTEENEKRIAYEIGENIAKIWKSEGKWFGQIKNIENEIPIGEYKNMEEYYDTLEKKIIKFFTEKNLISKKEIEKLHKAIQIIKNDFNSGTKTSLNHEDIQFDNIFLTDPITVFDPNPQLWHPLADLVWTEFYLLSGNIKTTDKKIRKKSLWEWYEKTTGERANKNVFNACMTIRIFQKARYRFAKWRERTEKLLKILDEIKLN